MSDILDQSPPAPTTSDNTPPPSTDTPLLSPPPQSDQSSGSTPPPPDNPSTPPAPPPPDDTSTSPPSPPPSPPSGSPPPSPPPSSSSPPPAVSNSPPPVSNSPPPTVPILSPPPQQSPPLSPPPTTKPSSPPPPSRSTKSPPPQEFQSPPPQEFQSPPPPKSDPLTPPSPVTKSPPPPNSQISPPAVPSPNYPPAYTPPTALSPPPTPASSSPPPGSNTTTPSQAISPPGSTSRSDSSTPPSSSSDESDTAVQTGVQSGAVVGVAVAGVFLVAVIALFFVCSARRRRRKRSEVYAAPQRYIPSGNMSVKSDGFYPGQQHHNINFNSGPADFYPPPTSNSYGMSSGGGGGGGGGGGMANSGGGLGGPNPYFSYEELMEITNGFSSQNILGEGGFGCVYKGWLPDGKVVAVKQLKAGSGQGEREFKAEVEIISRVHHRHLVSLVGYCISEHHRLLIYEFVPNNTLEHHLHAAGLPVLDWSKRLKIALGAAKGLAYLHEDCHPKIIHRDIKSANILLEDSFEAQVADFGLAKPSNDMNTHVSTRVMGTFGYMAPEYASSGKLTDRSDVFSFGVVLLELITGRKPVDPTRPLGDESLVEWARPLLIRALESGDLSELVDPRLENRYVESEMTRMVEAAAACVRHSAPKRPKMVQVARALDCGGEMSDLSNGVKYGQSTIYESGQYNQDIMRFRKMALEDSSEYDKYSGEFGKPKGASQDSWKPVDSSSGESETRAFTSSSTSEQKYGGPQSNFGNRYF